MIKLNKCSRFLEVKKATKTAVKKQCQNIIDKRALTSEEKTFLIECVFSNHEDIDKIRTGQLFVAGRVGEWSQTTGVTVIYKDGTFKELSYNKMLTPISPRQKIMKACREAVSEQIMDFRNSKEHTRCAITGEPLKDGWHVDHTGDFEFVDIVDTFITTNASKNNVTKDKLIDLMSKNVIQIDRLWKFKDDRITKSFQQLHKLLAVLQPTNARANMKKGRRKNG